MTNQTTPLTADLIARTEEGTAALFRAGKKALADPARAAFLVAAATNVGSELAGATKLAKNTNVALLPLLAASNRITWDSIIWSVAGMIAQSDKADSPENPTLPGVLGTMTTHGGYIAHLTKLQPHISTAVGAAYTGVWAAGTILAAVTSRQHLPAVALGGAVVAYGAALAQDPKLRKDESTQGVSHGTNLALAAEGITFAKNLLPAKATFLKKAANAAEAGLFAVGHLLLHDGLSPKRG